MILYLEVSIGNLRIDNLNHLYVVFLTNVLNFIKFFYPNLNACLIEKINSCIRKKDLIYDYIDLHKISVI